MHSKGLADEALSPHISHGTTDTVAFGQLCLGKLVVNII